MKTTTMKKRLRTGIAAGLAAMVVLAAGTAAGVTINEDWMPDWIEDGDGGYYRYPVAITCSERDESSDFFAKLNNGCSLKVGKTNASGITKFTVSYLDSRGRKQTVSHAWRDDEGGVEFAANGRRYWFNWDATPYGAWLVVYDDNEGWEDEHFYVIDFGSGGAVTIPAEWQKARTLGGVWGEGCDGSAEGVAQLKCGKANKKGVAKVSLTITPFSGRKRTYAGVSVDVSQGGTVEVNWPKQGYRVSIDGDAFFGEPIYGDVRPACSPGAVWSADVGGALTKAATFDFGDVPELSDSTGYAVPQELWLQDSEGDFLEADVFAPIAVAMGGNKWTCPKATGLRWQRCPRNATCSGHWTFNARNGTANLPGLKLTYNAKTGIFKGSFSLYADFVGKKYAAKVTGVVIDGEGQGLVSCPKLTSEPWSVTVQ